MSTLLTSGTTVGLIEGIEFVPSPTQTIDIIKLAVQIIVGIVGIVKMLKKPKNP